MKPENRFPIFVRSGRRKSEYKAGYIDSAGTVIVQPIYDHAGVFRDGFGSIKLNGLWGAIDAQGKVEIPFVSSMQLKFFEGVSVFSRPGRDQRGIIDKRGVELIPPIYTRVGSPREGCLWVDDGRQFRFVRLDGTSISDAVFDDARSFSFGLAPAKFGDKWGYVDYSGSFVVRPQFDFAMPHAEGLGRVQSNGMWGFIDTEGRPVISASFEDAMDFSEGLAEVKIDKRWGYIDQRGAVSISPCFSHTGRFADGLANAEVEGRTGYIDKAGRFVIAPKFFQGARFSNGLALVETDAALVYVDRSGNTVWTGKLVDVPITGLD